jgi:hypothetical protein
VACNRGGYPSRMEAVTTVKDVRTAEDIKESDGDD